MQRRYRAVHGGQRWGQKMKRMCIMLAALLAVVGCSTPILYPSIDKQTSRLRFQFRVAGDQDLATGNVDLVTNNGIGGFPLRNCRRLPTQDYILFENDALIHWDSYRAIAIEPGDGVSRIFELSIPLKPELTDWSDWRGPSYTSRERMIAFHLCHGANVYRDKRDMGKPPKFELRYKVEEYKSPQQAECTVPVKAAPSASSPVR
jgi:hypothetical protein